MLLLLRHPVFGTLFAAQVVALLGTGLLTVALGLLAVEIAGAAAGAVLGTALTIKMIAYVGVAPVIAALVDRLPKRAVLVSADLVRLAAACALPLVHDVWHIYVLVFVLQAASATFTPAFQSLIPTVLPEARDYTRALSLSRLAYDLEAIVSPLLAAALLTVLSYSLLFVGTAFGFALSALFVLITALPKQSVTTTTSFWQRLPLGLRAFFATPSLRFVLCTNVVVAAATALVLVNSVVYVRVVYDLGDQALAFTLGAYGLGSLVVALALPRVIDAAGPIAPMRVGIVTVVVALVAASTVTALPQLSWTALLAVWALLGAGTSMLLTPSSRLLAAAATDTTRNLIYTAQFALSHACFLVTYPVAGWLGATSLLAATLVLTLLALVAGLAGFALARRLPRP